MTARPEHETEVVDGGMVARAPGIAGLIVAAWNEGRIDSKVPRLLADGMVLHGPRPDGVEGFAGNAHGKVAFIAHLRQLRGAFGAAARMTLVSAIGQGERVAAIYRLDGVHVGLYLGVPPTGRPLTLIVQDHYLLRDGRIVEAWHAPDRFSLIDTMSAAAPIRGRAGSTRAEIVAELPPGCFAESIVEHPNGDLYVTLQFDGQIVRLADGRTSVFAQLPAEAMTGSLAGMVTLNVDTQGRIIVVVLSDHRDYQRVAQPDAASRFVLDDLPDDPERGVGDVDLGSWAQTPCSRRASTSACR